MTNCVFNFDWRNHLKEEVTKDYFLTLLETIEKEEEKFIIYPARVDRSSIVLLLNASLTVRKGEANSHSNLGWIPFTDSIISNVANTLEGVVFLLWGKDAQRKINRIDSINSF